MEERPAQNRPLDVLNARGLTAKREYVRGLEQRHDDEALSLLVECLCDESWYLRDLAEQAFVRLGDTGAAVLLPLLEQGLWYTRTSAARVLGRMGYRPAVRRLLRLAEDANATVALAAREALLAIAGHGGASGSEAVRAGGEGVEWEVLTGAPPNQERSPHAGGSPGGEPR